MKPIHAQLLCLSILAAPLASAETIASQDFGATNFPATLDLDNGNIGSAVTHAGSGASGTDLGFSANGRGSTTSGNNPIFEVSGGVVSFSHFSSNSDVSNNSTADALTNAPLLTFAQGTDHTAFLYTQVVDIRSYNASSFSMDVGDLAGATNTDDDDIVVRLWINNTTEVVLVDTRGNANGALTYGNITHNFQDTDVSAQLLVDLFTDDDTDGYRIDNILFQGTADPNAPTFNSDPISTSNAQANIAYTDTIAGTATDPNSDTLTYTKLTGPAWLTIAANGGLSGTPTVGDMGLNSFIVMVNDGNGGSDTTTLQIQVDADPNAPSFNTDPISTGDARATVAYSDTIAGSATDPNGDSLSYSKLAGPTWLNIATNGALTGTPALEDMSLNQFTIQVSDGNGGTDTAILQIQVNNPDGVNLNRSATDQIRLIWLSDPSATMTVAWKQTSGGAATVHYGKTDHGRFANLYSSTKGVDAARTYSRSGTIVSQFAGLSGLDPDTIYYFVLKDSSGTSDRYWFRTAPATPQPFSFIAGGDSRNNRTPRQKANRLVGKLRPLFVAFTGDMINSDNATEWNEWLDDWEQTTSSDGRMYPILAHRGNHESGGNSTLVNLFNCPTDNYYALNFGGSLLRYYVLNSESGESTQATWLQTDLDAAGGKNAFTHLMAGYHKPMRPHQSGKSEGSSEYNAWAQLFYDNRFDLIFESDSHTMKRTHPVRPDIDVGSEEGFITDLQNGTVYIGEGCWGAPLRAADDNKGWTAASGSFNGFDLIHVHLTHSEVFTVQVDNEALAGSLAEGDGLVLPQQVTLWQPTSGARLVVNRDAPIISSFAQYQIDAFGASIATANSGKTADYDGDKITNFMEFAFGLDATTASQTSPNFPNFVLESGNKKLKHHRRSNSTAKFTYHLSQDLNSWDLLQKDVDYTLTVTPGAGIDEVEVQLIGARAALERAFLRVDVEEQ